LCAVLIENEEGRGLRTTPEVRADDKDAALLSNIARNPTYRMPLPSHPIAAEQARILTKITLAHWGISGITDNALIITAELVTNAVKVGGVFSITLSRRDGAVLVEVWDSGEAAPDPRRRSVDRVDGRGLLLVEACSKEWGWRFEERGGKTVWAIVGDDTPGDQGAHDAVRM
jgi:hypothetical protein